MRAALKRPGPMAAIDPVQQDHQGHITAGGGLRRHKEGDVGALAERRTLDCYATKSFRFESRIRNFDCAKHMYGGGAVTLPRDAAVNRSGYTCVLENDYAFGIATGEQVIECFAQIVEAVGSGD